MTNALHIHQTGKYPRFLPNNFYEAPQYATYRPTAAIAQPQESVSSILGTRAEPSAVTVACTQQKRPAGRKAEYERKARAEEIHGWLDNLHLCYENYVATASSSAATALRPLSHMTTDATSTAQVAMPVVKKARGRPKKSVTNRLKPFLKNFIFPRDALAALPMFDDIVTGAVRLDAGGNTRPMSKTMMVSLLQVLDEVTTEAIQEVIHCSLRHAQRLAQYLRIIEQAGFKAAQQRWHAPSGNDWLGLD
jgi:hypothetical protein